MNYRDELLTEARTAIAQYPDRRAEIVDLYTLAVSEIEDGESPANEYELFMDSLFEITKGEIK